MVEAGEDGPRFVVQRHDASTLHYDFRLEIDGALASWAVPKGPSTDPQQKRLAVRVEDHELGYIDFEGSIGDGYGAGTVIVWDIGTVRPVHADVSLSDGLHAGHLSFWLDGHKISGGYALTRTGTRAGKEQWILVKRRDERADRRRDPARTELASVLSGRTNEDVAGR